MAEFERFEHFAEHGLLLRRLADGGEAQQEVPVSGGDIVVLSGFAIGASAEGHGIAGVFSELHPGDFAKNGRLRAVAANVEEVVVIARSLLCVLRGLVADV